RNTAVNNMSRRLILHGSLGVAVTGALARPYIANAAAKTATIWVGQGFVPDLIFHQAPETILPQNAWNDRLVDVSEVVEAQRSQLSETALLCSSFYNNTTKQRSFYLAPVKQAAAPIHIWGDLVRKAGFSLADAPKTWDAYWDFFKPMQKILRAKGMRKIYSMGLQVTTVGPNDGNNVFIHFLIANGGQDIVTKDGKLHTDDPQVREA